MRPVTRARARALVAGALALTVVTACTGTGTGTGPGAGTGRGPGTDASAPTRSPASPAGLPASQPPLPVVPAQVGQVRLQVEVAATPEQQAAGLRGRQVPPGSGMVFPYPGSRTVRFTMAGVDRPLVAVFARGGRAVSVERLVPCAGTVAACPTYGPDEPVDLVLEAAPASLPDARPGDVVVLGG